MQEQTTQTVPTEDITPWHTQVFATRREQHQRLHELMCKYNQAVKEAKAQGRPWPLWSKFMEAAR